MQTNLRESSYSKVLFLPAAYRADRGPSGQAAKPGSATIASETHQRCKCTFECSFSCYQLDTPQRSSAAYRRPHECFANSRERRVMVLKRLIGLVFAGAMVCTASADVLIRIAPRVVVERRAPPPSRTHVWISGYQRWNGNAYVWTAGHWGQPPRPHAHWVAHRWVHRRDGYVLVEGHWR